MFKKSLVLAGLCSVLAFCQNVNAQNIALVDLQDLPSAVNAVDQRGEIKQDHWVYKTLENITKKVNKERFDINKPLTRDEAAIILVSIVREIEKGKIEINEAEKIQLNILRNEFKNEARCLQGRIEALESNNNKLEARVSKLEQAKPEVKNAWSHNFGEKFKLGGFAQARFTSNIRETGDNITTGLPNDPSNFSLPFVRVGMSGKLHENLDYMTSFELGNSVAGFANLVDAYVTSNVLDNHTLQVGQARVPIGKEGTIVANDLDFIYRSQLASQFSDFRDLGVKVTGDYGFVNYDLGLYNGNLRNIADNNDDFTYGARIQFNPLINRSDKGELNIGGGYFIGRDNRALVGSPNGKTLSLFGSYKINKYEVSAEFGRRDDYLQEGRNADGLVLSNSYYITDKTQILARYDRFDPDTRAGNDRRNRYIAGVNYYLAKHLKLMANLVHEQRKAQKDAQQLIFQTQYKF